MNTATIEIARHYLIDAPIDAASRLESLPAEDSAAFFEHVPAKVTSGILLCLSPGKAAAILVNMDADSSSNVLALLNPNQIASFLRTLKIDQHAKFLKILPENRADICQKLLNFEQGCIGAHAVNEVPLFSNNLNVDECLVRIKKQNFIEANTVFINDTDNHYVGALKLSSLLTMPGKTKIGALRDLNTLQLSGLTPLNTALNLDIWLQQDIIAVVDSKQFFVGSLSYQGLRRAMQIQRQSLPESSPLLTEMGSAFTVSMLGLLNEFNPLPSTEE